MDLLENLRSVHKSSSALDTLFKIDNNIELLDKVNNEQYHSVTGKILYLSQRLRINMQLPVGYHCTRVKSPNVQDWSKLQHLIGYLWFTRYLLLIISINKDREVYICIDGAYTVHMDKRGHSELYLTMRRGRMINILKKLELITTNSTETEVVADRDMFLKCSCFRYF